MLSTDQHSEIYELVDLPPEKTERHGDTERVGAEQPYAAFDDEGLEKTFQHAQPVCLAECENTPLDGRREFRLIKPFESDLDIRRIFEAVDAPRWYEPAGDFERLRFLSVSRPRLNLFQNTDTFRRSACSRRWSRRIRSFRSVGRSCSNASTK